jgi:hypothetical protein
VDLRWWAIAVAGLLCVAVGAATAWLLPVERVARRLRPLAHVDRLTRLPEFARVHRIYVISMAITAGLLILAFTAAVVAAARPITLAAADDGYDAAHPRDIMLCVGQPVTDPTTADFLNYYAAHAKSLTNEQLGITSPDRRVMPLTRDNAYAEGRLRYFAGLAQIQQDIDTHKDVSTEQRLELAAGIESFASSVTYVDYAQSLEDALALCIAGFPNFDNATSRRRQLVYLGYSRFRGSDEKRPALFDRGQIEAMAQRGGIQLNAVSRADVAETSPEGNDMLRALTEATGGRFALYNPAGTAGSDGGASQVLTANLDKITDNAPAAPVAGSNAISARYFDSPQVALAIAVVAAAVLSVSLGVLRR